MGRKGGKHRVQKPLYSSPTPKILFHIRKGRGKGQTLAATCQIPSVRSSGRHTGASQSRSKFQLFQRRNSAPPHPVPFPETQLDAAAFSAAPRHTIYTGWLGEERGGGAFSPFRSVPTFEREENIHSATAVLPDGKNKLGGCWRVEKLPGSDCQTLIFWRFSVVCLLAEMYTTNYLPRTMPCRCLDKHAALFMHGWFFCFPIEAAPIKKIGCHAEGLLCIAQPTCGCRCHQRSTP